MKATDLLSNAYVLEGDLIIKSPELIQKYQYEPNYPGVPVERTDNWCFTAGRKKIINGIVAGGTNY